MDEALQKLKNLMEEWGRILLAADSHDRLAALDNQMDDWFDALEAALGELEAAIKEGGGRMIVARTKKGGLSIPRKIVELLRSRPCEIVSHHAVWDICWGQGEYIREVCNNTLYTNVSLARRLLRPGEQIHGVSGRGYRFWPGPDSLCKEVNDGEQTARRLPDGPRE